MAHILGCGDHLVDTVFLFDELEAIAGLHTHALTHLLRDGDLALACDGRGTLRPMNFFHRASKLSAVVVVAALFAVTSAAAAEIKVMISGGFSAAYRALGPQFERE